MAAAAENAHPQIGRDAGDLLRQAGLADTRLTGDQCHRGLSGHHLPEQRTQPAKLVASTYEDGADQVSTHVEHPMASPHPATIGQVITLSIRGSDRRQPRGVRA